MEGLHQSMSWTQQWHEIESISLKMHELAMSYNSDDSSLHDEQNNSSIWHDVAALDSKRLRLLNSFFDQSISDDEKEMLREKVNHLLATNKELTVMSSLIQKNISKVLSTMGQQQRAVSTYGNIQSL